jgi:leucyl/phenylalanyl-tRNA---protein transferase
VPVPLPPPRWGFDPTGWPVDDAVAVGADLEPATLLAAYRAGLFPMPLDDVTPMVWWSPLRRGVLTPERLRVSRSLRQAVRRYETRVDTAFSAVLRACADPMRPGAWISEDVLRAFARLHALGWAHSVETWDRDGRLVGGLYGVAIGGLFAGESMFHHARDASKVALVRLVELLDDGGRGEKRLVDVQWQTPHLASLGVDEIDRDSYLAMLPALVDAPLPSAFDREPVEPAESAESAESAGA